MKNRQPDFNERFRKSLLLRKEPDMLPLGELGIHPIIKEAYLGRPIETIQDEIDFAVAAGYDYIKLSPKIVFTPDLSKGSNERTWASEYEGCISGMEDFENFNWPDPDKLNYSHFEEACKILPDGMKIIGQYGDIYTLVWTLLGFEDFSFAMIDNTELIDALYEKIGGIIYSLFKTMSTFDQIGALWYSDDIAYQTGLMVSPSHYRDYLFPWMKKIGDLCKENDYIYLYHSDGILWDVMDDLYDCGVNVLQPIERKAMNIKEVKERVGDKFGLIGNVDLSYTLTRGTPEETAEEVKGLIREMGPGGGYAVGSENTVPEYVKPECYRAMVDTVKEFGKYPIDI